MYHIHFTLRIWKRTGGVYLTVFCSGILSPLGNQIYGKRIKMCGVRLWKLSACGDMLRYESERMNYVIFIVKVRVILWSFISRCN